MDRWVKTKVYTHIAALFCCTILVGVVALWGIGRQKGLVTKMSQDSAAWTGQMEELKGSITALSDTTSDLFVSAGELQTQIRELEQLLKASREYREVNDKADGRRLSSLGYEILERYMDRSRFLVDALIKSKVMKENISGLHAARLRYFGDNVEKSSIKPEQEMEALYTASDAIQVLSASAAADFFALVELEGQHYGRVIYSDDDRLVGGNIGESSLFEQVRSENRIAKGIDRLGSSVIVGAGAVVRDTKGRDVAVLIAGFRISPKFLLTIERELGVDVGVLVNPVKSEMRKSSENAARPRAAVIGAKSPFPLEVQTAYAQTDSEPSSELRPLVDARAKIQNLTLVREVASASEQLLVAYSPLLTNRGRQLGTIAYARDISGLTQHNRMVSDASEKISSKVAELEAAKVMNGEKTAQQGLVLSKNLSRAADLQALFQATSVDAERQTSSTRMFIFVSFLIALGTFCTILTLIRSGLMRPLETAFSEIAERERRQGFYQQTSSAANSAGSLSEAMAAVSRHVVETLGAVSVEPLILDRGVGDVRLGGSTNVKTELDEDWKPAGELEAALGAKLRQGEAVRVLRGADLFPNLRALMPSLGEEVGCIKLVPVLGARGEVILLSVAIGDKEAATLSIEDDLQYAAGQLRMVLDRDINARLLLKSKEAAEKAMRSKSDFLANMSHEIRTPMTGILGFSEILVEEALSESNRNAALTVRDSAKALLTILNEILDISKMEAGKFVFDSVPFNMPDLITNIKELFSVIAAGKNLSFSVEKSRFRHTDCIGDPGRIRQILINLVGNSLKFTESGEVRLVVEDSRPGYVRFTVVDTGIGISEDELGRIFVPFEQADMSATRRFGGTGLGLSISKRLAELMGGSLMAQSVPGHGSWFIFEIPLLFGAKSESRPPIPELTRDYGRRVLLVEDNIVNQKVANRILGKLGLTVTVANNGEEALSSILKEHFDLVFMDIQMPVMDGITATKRIRGSEKSCANVPIVALTANVLNEYREECERVGMNGFLTKPFILTDIVRELDAWLTNGNDTNG